MDCILDGSSKSHDSSHALELAESVWWVGHHIPEDPFQCHTYLIDDGDSSVLIDPGSLVTFKWTLKKIEEVMPFRKIKYFIVHHQDPDITAALVTMDSLIDRDDALILSHWRTNALLKHFALDTPLSCVEEMGWRLDLPHRQLDFIFTPYLHFAGAFTTYDRKSQILFSSDIFGGFTDQWQLVAEDESYFDSMKLFHEHYMPSKEILNYSLSKFEKVKIRAIAPQHGSVIPEPLVSGMIAKLGTIDCGIFLDEMGKTTVNRLSLLHRMVKDSYDTLIFKHDFSEIRSEVLDNIKHLVPVQDLKFLARDREGTIVELGRDDDGETSGAQSTFPNLELIGITRNEWHEIHGNDMYIQEGNTLVFPVFSLKTDRIISILILTMAGEGFGIEYLLEVMDKITPPLGAAVEREVLLRGLITQAMKDALTGLYTRRYMSETAKRLVKMHDRNKNSPFSVIMFDIDHFKQVNDSYGHGKGDEVLALVARVIDDCTRGGDINVRYGGEEFLSLIAAPEPGAAGRIAERVRLKVRDLKFNHYGRDFSVTISGGVAARRVGEPFDHLVERADRNLYKAKEAGRNRIVTD